ncbi:MAG: hypothetical protein WC199_05280 [Dysgonamonadaceae bacterium]|jgi:hypothetical protein|nr:hypothetical protein [Sphaerochaetaceae bacterium]MDD5076870.1 hypothetical protein [Sphaerochaetaceae bacterium]MDX9933435.1 hypothetical protein [Sphaerochaetaceae bacterium]NLO59898.1 hypothetical protein [Spirochaetales bacterium]
MIVEQKQLNEVIEHCINTYDQARTRISMRRNFDALSYRKVDRLPVVYQYPSDKNSRWRPVDNRFTYKCNTAMLYNQLINAWDLHCVDHDLLKDDLPFTVRPNWGTVTVASLFGFVPEQRDDQTPWIRRGETPYELDSVFDANFDIKDGLWVKKIIKTYEYYHEVLSRYPELKDVMIITLPDLQGPFDTLEQIMGESLFLEMIDRPDVVRNALIRVAEVQIDCMRLFETYCTEPEPGFSHQHGTCIRGNILIRNDSAVMISPELYAETVSAADSMILQEAHGGAVHSCGKIDHVIDQIISLPNVVGIDFGQSYMNDVQIIYQKAKIREIPLLRIRPTIEEMTDASILDTYPTGMTLVVETDSLQQALKVHEAYLNASEKR